MKALLRALPTLAAVALLGLTNTASAQTSPAPAAPAETPAVQPVPSAAAPIQIPTTPAATATPTATATTEAAPVEPAPTGSIRKARPATVASSRVLPAAPREDGPVRTAEPIRIALILTLLGLIPALAICVTPFIRIIVVLSMIRHAMGMPETPPNQVLVSLALFLTIFTILPTCNAVNNMALQPFLAGRISVEQAMEQGQSPVRAFMLRQVADRDLKTIYEISKQPLPASASQVGFMQLTSAFMLNELRVGFKIGFVILLPFVLIDLIVSSILLSLGMLMVPPATLSLPLKVLMFVLIDGWSLVLQGVVGSFK